MNQVSRVISNKHHESKAFKDCCKMVISRIMFFLLSGNIYTVRTAHQRRCAKEHVVTTIMTSATPPP